MSTQLSQKLKIVNEEIIFLKKNMNWETANQELNELILISEKEDFWNDPMKAQKTMKDIKLRENKINILKKISNEYKDIKDLEELAIKEDDQSLITELDNLITELIEKCEQQKLISMFSKKNDLLNCFLEIHAGAGGTEAQDWAMMLQRM